MQYPQPHLTGHGMALAKTAWGLGASLHINIYYVLPAACTIAYINVQVYNYMHAMMDIKFNIYLYIKIKITHSYILQFVSDIVI